MTDNPIYEYVPHRRTQRKLEGTAPGPVKTVEQMPSGTAAQRFNTWLAVKVTSGVGTMWCAYAFAALALVSLPSADADAVLHEAVKIQEHLLAQDRVLADLADRLARVEPRSGS